MAIAYWCEDFKQVSDEAVAELIERCRGAKVKTNDSDTYRGNRGQIMERETEHRSEERAVRISAGAIELEGNLGLVEGAEGVVLFAHGSGSGRSSPRNLYVARVLRQAGLSTLLIDLLTAEEEAVDLRTRQLRFDIGVLAERLVEARS